MFDQREPDEMVWRPNARCAAARLAFALALALAPLSAHADSGAPDDDPFDLEWSYLYDGGAVPFVFGAGAAAVSLYLFAEPRDTPWLFSASEGGEPRIDESIPDIAVAGMGALAGLGVAAWDRDARWFHTKGFVESFCTTAALTELSKGVVGRHRPRFDPALSDEADDRKSFFSGHASLTWSTVTYLGLYLRQHAFATRRGTAALAWWEMPAYASLLAVGVYIPYTRVDEGYHHVSDVLVGASVGSATAALFYWWQQRRYERAAAGARREGAPSLTVMPLGAGRGVQLVGTF